MDIGLRARSFEARVGVFYGALFVIYGMHVPFMPVWLDGRGLSSHEISTIMAAPFFLRLFITPGVALSADQTARHRSTLIVLAWLSLAIALALSQAMTFWPILVLTVPLIITFSTIMPLTETIAVSGVRHAGLDYGRMRLWGSLTFILASFIGGMAISRWGSEAGIWLIALGCVATVAAAHVLPHAVFSDGRPLAAAPPVPWWKADEPMLLLRQPVFLAFLLAAGGVQAAHATLMTFGTLIWQKQGLSGGWTGALWAMGVIAEIGLFAVSGWLVRTVGAAMLLVWGSVFSIVRWIAMAFEPGLMALVPLQVLHGITYGASHIGAIHFIGRAVPTRGAGSAQALYATVAAGVAMGVATLVAGWAYVRYGAASYLTMAGISAISLVAAIWLHRHWRNACLISDSPQNRA